MPYAQCHEAQRGSDSLPFSTAALGHVMGKSFWGGVAMEDEGKG